MHHQLINMNHTMSHNLCQLMLILFGMIANNVTKRKLLNLKKKKDLCAIKSFNNFYDGGLENYTCYCK